MTKARTLADMISDGVIGTTELADDVITPVKLDETGNYTIAQLDVNGTITSDGLTVGGNITLDEASAAAHGEATKLLTASGNGYYQDLRISANDYDFRYGPSAWNSAYSALQISSTGSVVFNESGQNADFRVESDNNTHALFVEAGANRVGINNNNPNSQLDISGAGVPRVTLTSTSGPYGYMEVNTVGSVGFGADPNGSGNSTNMAFNVDNVETARFYSDLNVFNEGSGNVDFRIESDNNANMLFVDAGADAVCIGTNSPDPNGGVMMVQTLNTHASGPTFQSNGTTQLWLKDSDATSNTRLWGFQNSGGALNFLYADDDKTNNFRTPMTMYRGSDGIVINEDSHDQDFRVESDSNTHMLFVDAGQNSVVINNSGTKGDGTNNSSLVARSTVSSGSTEAPFFVGYSSTGIGDGFIMTSTDSKSYLTAASFNDYTTDYETKLVIRVHPNSTPGHYVESMRFGNSEVVVNEQSRDCDFRVESNNNANMFTVDAGNDIVSFAKFGGSSNVNGGYFKDSNNGFFHQVLTNTTSTGTNANLYINRQGSEGQHIQLRVADLTKGMIGAETDSLNQGLYLGFGDTGLAFQAKADNAITPMNTNTGVARDNAIDLGAAGARFDDIYATNGTIQTSDRNEKQDIAELSEAEQRVAVAAKSLMRKYRWKDSVAEKGDAARTHFGIIAQDLQAAFEAEGLDAHAYAMFTSNTEWKKEIEKPVIVGQDDNGNTITEMQMVMVGYKEPTEGATEHTRLGVRYPELFSFIISAI